MAKADLRKADGPDWRAAIGAALERTRLLAGFASLKELAAAIGRDERQIARWIAGTERPQFDALFAVAGLRQPLVVALAELAQHDGVDIVTQITVRRSA
jgi:transcriptional regulator with XRE-family HTH domain